MIHKTCFSTLFPAVLVLATWTNADGAIFGGIDFPDGAVSFADAVISYDPLFGGGPAPTDPNFLDPSMSLGIPDYAAPIGSVSLGKGGLLEVEFTDNLLTNSGDVGFDLHIFEIGPDVEDTFVAVRPTASTLGLLGLGPLDDANGDGFFEVGKVFGATSSIDIDAIFAGFGAGELLFDAVQLIDDPDEGRMTGSTVGADIDAVGAIASAPAPDPGVIPEPTAFVVWSLLGLTVTSASRRQRRTRSM